MAIKTLELPSGSMVINTLELPPSGSMVINTLELPTKWLYGN